jgi:hypothetical protein
LWPCKGDYQDSQCYYPEYKEQVPEIVPECHRGGRELLQPRNPERSIAFMLFEDIKGDHYRNDQKQPQ